MKNIFKINFSILAMLMASITILSAVGCVTTGTTGNATLIERSKDQTPAWISMEPGKLVPNDKFIHYHGQLTQIPDLPLGIKDAQTQALQGSEQELIALVKSRLNGGKSETSESEALVIQIVKRSHADYFRLADLYFEKFRSESRPVATAENPADTATPPKPVLPTEFYTAHVLLQFPKEQLDAVVEEVSRRLQDPSKPRNPSANRPSGNNGNLNDASKPLTH